MGRSNFWVFGGLFRYFLGIFHCLLYPEFYTLWNEEFLSYAADDDDDDDNDKHDSDKDDHYKDYPYKDNYKEENQNNEEENNMFFLVKICV